MDILLAGVVVVGGRREREGEKEREEGGRMEEKDNNFHGLDFSFHSMFRGSKPGCQAFTASNFTH